MDFRAPGPYISRGNHCFPLQKDPKGICLSRQKTDTDFCLLFSSSFIFCWLDYVYVFLVDTSYPCLASQTLLDFPAVTPLFASENRSFFIRVSWNHPISPGGMFHIFPWLDDFLKHRPSWRCPKMGGFPNKNPWHFRSFHDPPSSGVPPMGPMDTSGLWRNVLFRRFQHDGWRSGIGRPGGTPKS